MRKWADRTNNGATLQECFDKAKIEIEDSTGLQLGADGFHYLNDLMAFVATRYLAAQGEQLEGLALEQYNFIKEMLRAKLIGLLHIQKNGHPTSFNELQNEELNKRFEDVSKTMVNVLEERIPEWANGRQSELGGP